MLDFYLAPSEDQISAEKLRPRCSLGGGIYWFLHRYFVQACLVPGDFSFLNQYEDTEISGYQLHRLHAELKEAASDVTCRPDNFEVLVGWRGEIKSAETEDWFRVGRDDVLKAIDELLSVVADARKTGLCVFAVGD